MIVGMGIHLNQFSQLSMLYKYYGSWMDSLCHGTSGNIESAFLPRLNSDCRGCTDLCTCPERAFADGNGGSWRGLGDSSGYPTEIFG